MSDEADWAAAVTTEADDDAVTPFAACDDDTAVTYPNNMGAAQTLTAGFANSLARVAAVDAVAWAIVVAETVVTMVSKADAETGTTEVDAAADVGVGCAAGCGERAHCNGASDKN